MSSEPVQLFLDDFMIGLLPKDGDRIMNDVLLTGTDGTTIIVKQNSGTTYKELPRKVFEATSSKVVLFKFQFPVGTTTNPDSTTFTTPDKSVYTFSTGDGVNKNNDVYDKIVTEGTIRIRPPDEIVGGSRVGHFTTVAGSPFVNNDVIQESSLGDTSFDDMKDNPFYNVGLIVYNVLMDMVIVVIFWFLFLSISCWLKVPANYLYPTDITKFPFIYFQSKGDLYYEYTTTDKESICKLDMPVIINKKREKQQSWFDELKKFGANEKEKSEILNIIYPELLKCDEKDVNVFSKTLIDYCGHDEDLTTFDYFLYIIKIIVFQNFIYCSSVTSMIHSFCAFISNEILGSPMISDLKIPILKIPFIAVLFAGFLYGVFLSSGALNEQVKTLFQINIPEGTDTQTIMLNQFLNLLVYFLTCCMVVFVPLFSLLLLVCICITSYILMKNLIFPHKFVIWILCFMLVISALNTYGSLSLVLAGLSPVSSLTHGLGVFTGITLILSMFSIGIPILSALGYAGSISVKLVISLFKLFNLETVSKMIKKTMTSLIIISLMLLVMRVKDRLGQTYMMITLAIIFLMGFGFLLGG